MTIGKLLRKILILTFILKVSTIPLATINRNTINPQLKSDNDDGKYKLQQNGNYLPSNGINLQGFRNSKNSFYLPTDILNILSQINDVENHQNDYVNLDDELWNQQKFDESQYESFENYNDKQEIGKYYDETLFLDNKITDIDYAPQTEYDSRKTLIVPVSLSSLKYQNKFSDDRFNNLQQTDAEKIPSKLSRQETHDMKKRQFYWKHPLRHQEEFIPTTDRFSLKRNPLAAFKRQKFKSLQTQFIPSISVEAMTHLGDFFGNLKNNIEFMETGGLSHNEGKLLKGNLPEPNLSDNVRPTGSAAFLHAVRSYRPSQRIRSLVSMTPDGYHGSQFLDPNYMWVGLG